MGIMQYWDTWVFLLFFVIFLVITILYRNKIGRDVQVEHKLDSDKEVEKYFSGKQERVRIIFFAFIWVGIFGMIVSFLIEV